MSSTDDAIVKAAKFELRVDYNQFNVHRPEEYDTVLEFMRTSLADLGQDGENLVIGGVDAVVVGTGISTGRVAIDVECRTSAPSPLTPRDLAAWEDVAEVSFESTDGEMWLHGADQLYNSELGTITPRGPGPYRLRVLARGRTVSWDSVPDDIVERYQLTIWPSHPTVRAVYQHRDRLTGRIVSGEAPTSPS